MHSKNLTVMLKYSGVICTTVQSLTEMKDGTSCDCITGFSCVDF